MKEYKFKYKKEELTGVIMSVDWNENIAKVIADDGKEYKVQVYSIAMSTSKAQSFTFFDVLDDIKKDHPKRQ